MALADAAADMPAIPPGTTGTILFGIIFLITFGAPLKALGAWLSVFLSEKTKAPKEERRDDEKLLAAIAKLQDSLDAHRDTYATDVSESRSAHMQILQTMAGLPRGH